MIKEDYVNFEIAKLLKDKGFDEKVICYYDDGGSLNLNKFAEFKCCNQGCGSSIFSAPTLQMAMKWLREEKGVYIEIPIVGMEWKAPTKWYFGWRCQTKDVIDRLHSQDANYTSYEETAEEAIKYCLENLI